MTDPTKQMTGYGVNGDVTPYMQIEKWTNDRELGKKYIYKTEHIGGSIYRYQYKRPSIFDEYCMYNILVDKKAKKILSWEFDERIYHTKVNLKRETKYDK